MKVDNNVVSRVMFLLVTASAALLGFRAAMAYVFSASDSWYPMSRALEVLHGDAPGDVYRNLIFTQHVKFQYPPSGVLPMELMNWLGATSFADFNAINAVLLLALGGAFAILAVRVLEPLRMFGIDVPIAPLAFIVAIKFYPNHFAMALGQIQVLIGLLFVLACLAIHGNWRLTAGLLMAIAAAIKPQFLLFGLLAFWRKDWRFVAGFAVVTALAVAIATGLYGLEAQVSYYRDVLPFLSQHGECFHTNQSVNGLLNRMFPVEQCVDQDPNSPADSPVLSSWFPPYSRAIYIGTLISSLLLLVVPFLLGRLRQDAFGELCVFCIGGIVFTMASPIAWVHHYNVILPAFILLFAAIREKSRPIGHSLAIGAMVMGFVLVAFPISPPFAATDPSRVLFQSHVLVGACLTFALLLQVTVKVVRANASSRPVE